MATVTLPLAMGIGSTGLTTKTGACVAVKARTARTML